ncbi:MAG: SpoIIE family protein phosphatase, partial [Acidobacteriaceae bacterium]
MLSESKSRVLVGEDQSEIQDALELLLGSAGYTVDSVSSPDEILKFIGARQYDLLLMDLNFRRDTTSGSEGLDVLSRLQGLALSPAVVVMTAWGSVDLAVKAMHLGARDFIQKPWENSHLLHVVEKQIESRRQDQSVRLRREREIQDAIEVQRRLLPAHLPEIPGIELAGGYWPAADVAGDYFDAIQFGGRIALCIADVIGKGMPAALMMSNLQAAVKVTATEWIDPAELCRRVNTLTCKNGAPDHARFISFFYGVYDPATRNLAYANAGHSPPLLSGANGRNLKLECADAVLGLWPDWQFHNCEIALEPGDRLLLYTDGLAEASRDSDGVEEEFGEERLLAALGEDAVPTEAQKSSADALLHHVVRRAADHCHSKFTDDVT